MTDDKELAKAIAILEDYEFQERGRARLKQVLAQAKEAILLLKGFDKTKDGKEKELADLEARKVALEGEVRGAQVDAANAKDEADQTKRRLQAEVGQIVEQKKQAFADLESFKERAAADRGELEKKAKEALETLATAEKAFAQFKAEHKL